MDSLGLRFSGDQVTAVLVPAAGEPEVRRLAVAELASLVDWFARAGSRVGAVADWPLLARRLTFPFHQARKIQQAVPVLLDDQVPGKLSDWRRLVRTRRTADGGEAWITLLPADAVDTLTGVLPETLSLRFLQPEALLEEPADGTVRLWLEANRATVVRSVDGALIASSISLGASALAGAGSIVTLRARLAAMVDTPEEVWVIDGPGAQDPRLPGLFEAMLPPVRWQIAAADPQALAEPDAEGARRAALAVRDRRRPVWNLAPRRSLFAAAFRTDPRMRQLLFPVALILLLTVLVLDLGRRTVLAEARALRNEVGAIYQRTFPGSRMIDPVRQMRGILERAGTVDDGGSDVRYIDRLAAISAAVTSTTITIGELRTAGNDWTVRGEAPDFATVDRLKSAVASQSWAKDVRVQRAEQTVDGTAIRFQLQWADNGERP